MHEALYYQRLDNKLVRCELCPRFCLLKPDECGFCNVRKNLAGMLVTLSYGVVSSVAIDPIEKKPLYHFFSGSKTLSLGGIGCNLCCLHCQNSSLSRAVFHQGIKKLVPEEVISLCLDRQCDLLVWTYNEPTIWYEYILDTARIAKKKGLKTVLVTAGGINKKPLERLLPFIDAYRLDIKGFTESLYRKLCGFPFLETVLQSAQIARDAGCHVEIVSNIIPNWNDDGQQMGALATWINETLGAETPWHVTAYYPALEMTEPPTKQEIIEQIVNLGRKKGLKHVFSGNIRNNVNSDTHCPACYAILIQRDGFTILCNRIKQGCCPDCGYRLQTYVD